MTKPVLPVDQYGRSIQALEPSGPTAGTLKLNIGAGSVSGAYPSNVIPGTSLVRIASVGDCYMKFGDSGVTATANDMLFPSGVEYLRAPRGTTHVAVLQVSATGVFTLTEVS